MKLVIPLIPPSVNHYKMRARNGHYFVTKEAKAFKEAIAIFYANGKHDVSWAWRYQVDVALYLGKGQRLDADNCGKVILDGLQEAGVISSDAKVMAFSVKKYRDRDNPRTVIEVTAL